MMRRVLRSLVATAVCLLLVSGCQTTHNIQEVKQHPTEDAATVETISTWYDWGCGVFYGPCSAVRYWHCTENDSDELQCDQVCGANMELECPVETGLVEAGQSPGSRLAIDQSGGGAENADAGDEAEDGDEEGEDDGETAQRREESDVEEDEVEQ